MTVTAQDVVNEAKTRIRNLTVEEFASASAHGSLILDVREPEERTGVGFIEGSLHVPRGMLEFHADPRSPYYMAQFDPGGRVLVYCAGGARSALAAETLQRMGYGDVAHLEGGLKAWVEAGRPVARGQG